ncbi:hypothetical protein E2C01_073907 [Portunus trituberculatus]|uniref:Uncharacterized protein n=1 Tax=Portunus trituberculatus TaxID=210409 RepID=A0A5B7I1Z5_PORTR|nr:hypothetical protein [Portunus trituberculatus]
MWHRSVARCNAMTENEQQINKMILIIECMVQSTEVRRGSVPESWPQQSTDKFSATHRVVAGHSGGWGTWGYLPGPHGLPAVCIMRLHHEPEERLRSHHTH